MTGWKEIIVWEFYDAKQNLHGSKYVGELIRCKDCKTKPRCLMYRYNKDPYGFCKWAEKKEE